MEYKKITVGSETLKFKDFKQQKQFIKGFNFVFAIIKINLTTFK